MASFCVSCGAGLDDAARFCGSCGRRIEGRGSSGADQDAPTFEDLAETSGPSVRDPVRPSTPVQAARRPDISARASSGRTAAIASGVSHGRFEPGTLLAGRYRIVGLLGRGGGEVYRADDLTLNQPVALKFLPAEVSRDRDRLARFRSEVSIARQVSHPNVCRVYDIGEVDGLTFLSMEYIDGEDLGTLLRRIGRLPSDKGVEVARQICAGLAAAHDRGVVHRDLKPGNVMIDGQGQARIADFGLAAAADLGVAEMAGTPAYMAPEQFEGKPATIQSDVYALGLVLYEIFTGKRAFVGSTVAELAAQHRERTPSSMSSVVADLDPAIERAIARCLEKDPAARPVSALAVSASLPGGDPLAAAIARGETPSPELVAASGSIGLVRPAYAIGVLAWFLAALGAVIAMSGYLEPALVVPLPDSPEVLRHRAQQIVSALGYGAAPVSVAGGLTPSEYLAAMRSEPWRTRFERLRRAEPPPIYFWYRQGAHFLGPWGVGNTRVSPGNPPEIEPGMIGVRLDPTRGRLHRFTAPPQRHAAATSAAAAAPDWSVAFQQAGLDIARFTSVAPTDRPPFYADVRAAWEGTYPDRPDLPIRVEAAGADGKVAYFEILQARHQATAQGSSSGSLERTITGVFMPILLLGMLTSAVLLMMRNLRLGRGDRRGALRIAIFLFLTGFAGSLLGADYAAQFGVIFNVVFGATSQALLIAPFAWTAYIALEPYARRRMPHVLISWSRLIAGRWRDPLVARHLLLGLALGLTATVWGSAVALMANGTVGGSAELWPLDGFRFTLQLLVDETSRGVLGGLGFFVLLLVLTLIVRRQWIATIVVVLVGSVTNVPGAGNPLATAVAAGVAWAIVLLGVWRFGLLTLVAAVFAINVVGRLPITFDPSSWFAPGSYVAIALLAGLALFGAWTAADLKTMLKRAIEE